MEAAYSAMQRDGSAEFGSILMLITIDKQKTPIGSEMKMVKNNIKF